MERAFSLPLPSGDLLELLKVNAPSDLLPFDDLEWVLDEAVDEAFTGNASADPAAGVQPGVANGRSEPALSTMSGESSHVALPGSNSSMSLPQAPGAASMPKLAGDQPHGASVAPSAAQGGMTDDSSQPPSKKKRTRNAEQMAQNRIAQQKYRERKKAEHEQLHSALEQLTAQLAAMKAMEVTAAELRAQNAGLQATVTSQAQQIQTLTQQVEEKSSALAAAQESARQAAELASTQQRMILDQHAKLQLQEEVIEALRGRLKERVEDAFGNKDPAAVCQQMCAAVRTALQGAKNVEGLQEALEKMPEHLIVEVCRAILCEVKKLWPELAARFHSLPGWSCSQAVMAAQ